MAAPLPSNEAERLETLQAYALLDTPNEPIFDETVALASYVFHAPIALVSLLDEHRQWFKARIGLDLTEAPREEAFCAYTILEPEGMVVPDALADPRFANNPMVVGKPGIRFYAGTPLITREGHALGTLCVIDTNPRPQINREQRQIIHTLGRHLMAQVEVRFSSAYLAKALLERSQAEREQRRRILDHEQELGRLNELKDHFMVMLAHELRNPLAPILNAIELLRSSEPGNALEIIERQVRHLTRLVEDLLDLSRITRAKITLKKARMDLVEALRADARAVAPALAKAGQQFFTDFPNEPLWIMADPVRLEQIVSNLLNNAAKFTESGKTIRLTLQQEGGMAVLRLKDEGIGIPAEMIERIFEPFVQLENAPGKGGLGLGLPLVRQLVHLHSGNVEVLSEGVGRGSEFIVRLPLAEAPVVIQLPAQTPEPVNGIKHRVIIVEDNLDFGDTLLRLLVRWGHEGMLVRSGTKAVEAALEFHPDFAIIDLCLPDKDGYAVAECLRGNPVLHGLKLIAMSGMGTAQDRDRVRQSGFEEFLLKPVDPVALRELLKQPR